MEKIEFTQYNPEEFIKRNRNSYTIKMEKSIMDDNIQAIIDHTFELFYSYLGVDRFVEIEFDNKQDFEDSKLYLKLLDDLKYEGNNIFKFAGGIKYILKYNN